MSRPGAPPPLLSVFAWLAPVCGSLAIVPLLDDNGYVLTAAVLAAGPLLAGVGLRLLRAPAGAVLLGQVVALAAWVTLLRFPGTAVGGMLPTPTTLDALSAQLAAGVHTANTYAPPAPATDGLVLLVAVSVTVCYLLVDLLGVGLGRVPLTGLPLLALYTVPAALAPDGVPALAFLPGAAAFLLLLGYDERERLAHWGRQISTMTGRRPEDEQRRLSSGAMNASATRVGVVALGAAAVLPLFVPVLPEDLLAGAGRGDGAGEVQVTNPIVDLRRDLVARSRQEAMRIRTGSGGASYFRLAALDEFDGQRWQFSDRDVDGKFDLGGGLSRPPGLAPGVRTVSRRFLVRVSPSFHSDWLPTPYAPAQVEVGGEWRYDPATLDIVAGTDEEDAAGRTYAVRSLQVVPTFEQLDTAGGAPSTVSGRYTELPDSVPDQVGDLAERVTEQGGSRFQRAVLLQEWFRSDGGFRYSLRAPEGHSGGDILAFLTERVGYCEQFAASMAVMARELDIPARVAVGFLGAAPVTDSAEPLSADEPEMFRYTFADLHAWPELYFEGVGWVRFEPTPAARGAAAPPYTTGDATGDPFRAPTDVTPLPEAGPEPTAPPGGLTEGGLSGSGGSPETTSAWWWAAAPAVLLAMLVPAGARVVLRRRRLAVAAGPVPQAEAVWAELRDAMRDLGYDWPVDTPRRAAARLLPLVRRRAGAESALRRLATTVERARFARTPGDGSTLRHDLALVVGALRARETRWDLVRAAALPRSLRATYRRQNRAESHPQAQRFSSLTPGADASALPSAP